MVGVFGRARGGGRRRTAVRPILERCEPRDLPSGGGHAHPAATSAAAELARYRVFEGSLPIAHGQTLSLKGPIVLGVADGRGQVVGDLFNSDGSRDPVVGVLFGGEVSLQLTLPGGRTLHLAGSGQLRRVSGGISGYEALMGAGTSPRRRARS